AQAAHERGSIHCLPGPIQVYGAGACGRALELSEPLRQLRGLQGGGLPVGRGLGSNVERRSRREDRLHGTAKTLRGEGADRCVGCYWNGSAGHARCRDLRLALPSHDVSDGLAPCSNRNFG
ncbi:unnamed protein product, partial [Effrenium voratum]